MKTARWWALLICMPPPATGRSMDNSYCKAGSGGAKNCSRTAMSAMMATPVAASGGQYGHGLVWLWGSDAITPGLNPDTAFGIPADTFWMKGHDGQSAAIIPSRELVRRQS